MFGAPLEVLLEREKSDVPKLIKEAIQWLEENGKSKKRERIKGKGSVERRKETKITITIAVERHFLSSSSIPFLLSLLYLFPSPLSSPVVLFSQTTNQPNNEQH